MLWSRIELLLLSVFELLFERLKGSVEERVFEVNESLMEVRLLSLKEDDWDDLCFSMLLRLRLPSLVAMFLEDSDFTLSNEMQ